ncbi:HNH endonuclease [Rugamonas fusca]|uniref:HNH endonuclease n=1 Tax=Rugamonas fusca TaxID=2758568 RepID=UPI001C70CA10|nr:HNH endonuclease [Rugamonas fusca]
MALNLYLTHRPKLPLKNGPEVKQLSTQLNDLAGCSGNSSTFRNANGVYMKLMNFLSIDPDYLVRGKAGLTRNNKDEQLVWNLFAYDEALLNATVARILAFIATPASMPELAGDDDDGFVEAEEGKLLTRVHRSRERSRLLVRKFKEHVRAKKGSLACEGCGLEAADKYGIEFADVMDVHHRRPVHTLQPGDKTKFSDLAILCASCHRIVHSRRKWLSIEQLQQLVAGSGRSSISR